MMSDIFDQEVVVPECFESSCLGAVVLGLYAIGKTDMGNRFNMVGSTHRHHPIKEHAEIYHQLLPILSKFHASWKRNMKRLRNSSRGFL